VDVTAMDESGGDQDGDQDMANDFMRQNFDPPDNLSSIRENAERFCQAVPDGMRIVLISVSRKKYVLMRSMT
jgi:hypothetical protein